VTLLQGDCLTLLPTLAAGSVDLVLADLPYGTTACKWDCVIPLTPLWEQYRRVLKPDGVIVLTACQPFTTTLINSNREWFRYTWVWDKVNLFTNQMNAKRMPMRQHEDILIFCANTPTYNPQWRMGTPYTTRRRSQIEVYAITRRDGVNLTGRMYPGTVIAIPGRNPAEQGSHPTQKPVALMTYLIRTYSNPGDTVLDNCFGSGTTGVAAVQEGRSFIGMEQSAKYFAIAERRIAQAQPALLGVA
jgi:site-specific DNA-methyltransferase (adenine-specific)